LLAGLAGLVLQLRKRKSNISEPHLSVEEAKRAADLLNTSKDF